MSTIFLAALNYIQKPTTEFHFDRHDQVCQMHLHIENHMQI